MRKTSVVNKLLPLTGNMTTTGKLSAETTTGRVGGACLNVNKRQRKEKGGEKEEKTGRNKRRQPTEEDRYVALTNNNSV
ncbi:hypothetical protein AMECASPLE_016581 [Ameca splendens]|uniref:Uncharacterized protein n=1 Tax=Ameca splendens TaxID=208324 RepID=A0ABV1A923_9TELE